MEDRRDSRIIRRHVTHACAYGADFETGGRYPVNGGKKNTQGTSLFYFGTSCPYIRERVTRVCARRDLSDALAMPPVMEISTAPRGGATRNLADTRGKTHLLC